MRILLIQTAFIGDCVLTTPLIRRASEIFTEEAVIVLLTTPKGAQVFDGNPHIDEIIQYDKHNESVGLSTFFGLANSLVDRRFDIAILPHRSFRSGMLSMLARIPKRVGFAKSDGSIFYTKRIERPVDKPEPERMLELLKQSPEDKIEPCPTEIFPGEQREATAIKILRDLGIDEKTKYATIAPGSVWGTKRYPVDLYGEVIKLMLSEGIVESVVLIGGPEDAGLCSIISDDVGKGTFSAAGKCDILTSAAIISKSRIFIGNDSGPGHLAAAVKTPVVSIFGPTVPRFGFVPYGEKVVVIEPPFELSCRPCSPHGKMECPRGDLACMVGIFPERVVQAVSRLLEG